MISLDVFVDSLIHLCTVFNTESTIMIIVIFLIHNNHISIALFNTVCSDKSTSDSRCIYQPSYHHSCCTIENRALGTRQSGLQTDLVTN